MAVRPVDIVSMQRMVDVSQIKQNENNKPMNDQVNFQNQLASTWGLSYDELQTLAQVI